MDEFELEHDYVVVDKQQVVRPKLAPPAAAEKLPILHHEYETLLYENKNVSNQLTKMVYSLEQAKVSGNNRDLWLAAANCVIKCMADVISEGEKLIETATTAKS